MTDYEKYRAIKDPQLASKPQPDSTKDARQKAWDKYNSNQLNEVYSEKIADSIQPQQRSYDSQNEGTTVINNYYDGDDDYYYANRFRRFDGPYYGYSYYDPYYYDPFWVGVGLGWGFGVYGYSPYYGYYNPGYAPYYSPYYHNHYYGGYNSGYYNGRNQINSGRRRIDTENRYGTTNRGQTWGPVSYGSSASGRTRQSVSSTPTTQKSAISTKVDNNSRTRAWESYRTTQPSSYSPSSGYARQRSTSNAVVTTRPSNAGSTANRRGSDYVPSYSVPGSSVRQSYNSSGGNYQNAPHRRNADNYSSGTTPSTTKSASPAPSISVGEGRSRGSSSGGGGVSSSPKSSGSSGDGGGHSSSGSGGRRR
jgi:hypothetical protein